MGISFKFVEQVKSWYITPSCLT